MKTQLTQNNFNAMVSQILGMPITHTWRGYGSAIFLEFGELHYFEGQNNPKGEFSLAIEWSWRVENKRSIWFGSFSADNRITNQLPKLEGRVVKQISLFGRLNEVCVNLENKNWISSFATEEGQPKWVLFFQDGSWCHVVNGILYHENDKIAESDAKH